MNNQLAVIGLMVVGWGLMPTYSLLAQDDLQSLTAHYPNSGVGEIEFTVTPLK